MNVMTLQIPHSFWSYKYFKCTCSKLHTNNDSVNWDLKKYQNIMYTVGKYFGRDRLFIELQWFSSRSKRYLDSHYIEREKLRYTGNKAC